MKIQEDNEQRKTSFPPQRAFKSPILDLLNTINELFPIGIL